MRLIDAFRHAMRARRTQRIGLNQAERWAAGDSPGPEHQGLAELLSAATAPATAEELAGEEAAGAAFAVAHRRAASPERRNRVRRSRTARTAVVYIAAGLALVAASGTAVAARTGNLPDGAQQHAHRLFSALGVPAPRTGPTGPAPTSATGTPGTTSRPSPTPAPAGPATPTTGAAPAGWCRSWSAAPRAGKAPWRRSLAEAAGGEKNIPGYCAALGRTPERATTAPTPGKPSRGKKPPGKPSSLPTPDHPGRGR
jgi:hypothetical protein